MKEETVTPKRFIQVFIKTEDDLPKEDDLYYVHAKNKTNDSLLSEFSFHTNKHIWMNCIDWYLQPESEGQSKWISIKDQTPPDYERVLWIDGRDGFINLEYFVWSQTPVDYVTHWMHLPLKP